jgi:predicted DNA-binding protein (UPF0251 family)
LPEGYNGFFNLYAIEGFKHKEIAMMLGINEGTSKSQLSHARKILQQVINKKSMIMEPNKFDQSIKEKMEARTIVPSAEAWEN